MKKLYTFLFLIFITIQVSAQWAQKNSMYDYGRYSAISMSIGGKGFVGLGQIHSQKQVYDFWRYDPQSNRWTRKSDYPGAGSYAATSFVINGKGFVCLGADSLVHCQYDLWEYDPVSDTWTQKADFPGTARYGAFCFVIGDTAFVGSGSYGPSDDYLYDMWMYVPATDTWTQVADFPGGPRNHATAFSIGNYGYAGSGLTTGTSASNDFWKYDKNSNSWQQISGYPGTQRMGMTSFVFGDNAYAGCGYDFYQHFNTFYVYNSITDTWGNEIIPPDGFIPGHAPVSFVAGDKAYIGTGKTDYGLSTELWEYSPVVISQITEKEDKILIYPNPATELIKIDFKNYTGEKKIRITSNTGSLIREYYSSSSKANIAVDDLAAGAYLVTIYRNKEQLAKKKIIISY